MKRKIAVFSTAWNGEHIGGILMGMRKKVQECGDDLYIFNTYGGFEPEQAYNECEYNIFKLPLESQLDGVVLISNNMDSINRLTDVIQMCEKKHLPCIAIELEIPGLHCIGTDNYAAMTAMVEHLVSVHGCKTFNYVGGPSDHLENCQRKQAFVDVLEKHGLLVEETRIRDYDFTREGGERAFADFYEAGIALPDAVVCANDNMAIGYTEALDNYGYSVPEDTIVTGFDNLFEAKCHAPGIASIGRSKEVLGEACIEQIYGMLEGKEYQSHVFLPFTFSPNESCGCKSCSENIAAIKKGLNRRGYQNQQLRWRMNLIQKRLLTCQTEAELNKTLYTELQNIDIQKFAILLNQEEDIKCWSAQSGRMGEKRPFSDWMRIVFQGKPDLGSNSSEVLETVKLVPEELCGDANESEVFLFMPLHMHGIQYGYCVMGEHIDYIENENLFFWISIMDLVIVHVRQNISIRMLNNKLSRMYMQDAMTGIYNRFALKHFGEPLLERNRMEGRRTLFLFADMDGLKAINDTYGHEAGDLSIKNLAYVMQQSCPDSTYFCIRYGGDEFLMMGTCDSEEFAHAIQENIEQKLREAVPVSGVPVRLSASIGYFLTSDADAGHSLDEYISQADQMMYQIKKERKQRKFVTVQDRTKRSTFQV